MQIRQLRCLALTIALLSVSTTRTVGAQAATAVPQQFSIMIWETPEQLALRTDGTRGGAYWAAFAAYGAELQKAGVLRGGTALRTGDAVRTVTVRSGRPQVAARAHVDSRTELGGYFVIEVATLDDAVRWAERLPSALTGAVEVRPAYPAPTMMK